MRTAPGSGQVVEWRAQLQQVNDATHHQRHHTFKDKTAMSFGLVQKTVLHNNWFNSAMDSSIEKEICGRRYISLPWF